MSRLEWLECFELGVPEIDGDHRTMFYLMRAVQSVAADDQARARDYLDRLFAFTKNHFAREDALLKDWGYPGAAASARYHTGLLEQAVAVRQTCAASGTREGFEECCNEMMSFLVDDVVRGGMKLKSFLDEAGLALSDRPQPGLRTRTRSRGRTGWIGVAAPV